MGGAGLARAPTPFPWEGLSRGWLGRRKAERPLQCQREGDSRRQGGDREERGADEGELVSLGL